jgi:hypothetical protein
MAVSNFGVEATDITPVPSYQTPTEGVRTSPVLFSGLKDLFDQAATFVRADTENKQSTLIGEFSKRQLLITEAYEQGGIKTSSQARAMMRKTLLEYINAHPSMAQEFLKVQNSLEASRAGLGVALEGTQEEQRRVAIENKAIETGYASAASTQGEIDAGVRAYEQAQQEAIVYEARKRRLEEQLRDINLSKAQRDEINAQLQQESVSFARTMAPLQLPIVQNKLKDILNDRSLTAADKVLAMDQFFATWQSEVATVMGDVGSNSASYLMQPFTNILETYKKMATGEVALEQLNREVDWEVVKQKALILADPEIAGLAAITELFGSDLVGRVLFDTASDKVRKLFTETLGKIKQNPESINPLSASPEEREAQKLAMEVMATLARTGTPEQKVEAVEGMKIFWENIELYRGGLERDPKRAIPFVEFLATNDFLQARNLHPEVIENNPEIVNILDEHYRWEVDQLISTQFRDRKVWPGIGEMSGELSGFDQQGEPLNPIPVGTLVTTRGTSSGMEFVPIDPANRQAVTEARRLNSELKPIINTSLKAFAHVEGRTDYGKMWEESVGRIFGEDGQSRLGGGDEGDELTLADFRIGINSVEPITEEEIVNISADNTFRTGGVMRQVEGMVIHHTGGRNMSGAVQTLKDRGLSVQFIVDRDGKVYQLTDKDNVIAFHARTNPGERFKNSNAIGVEVVGANDDDILDVQIQATKRLIRTLSEKYGFDPANDVVGHGEVASHKQATEGRRITSAIRGS